MVRGAHASPPAPLHHGGEGRVEQTYPLAPSLQGRGMVVGWAALTPALSHGERGSPSAGKDGFSAGRLGGAREGW